MNPHNPFVWFEIYVEDMARASKFYETVFDIRLDDLPDPTEDGISMRTFPGDMQTYGANGALIKAPDVKAGGTSTVAYFGSKDCTTEEQRIEMAGGKIHQSKMSIGKHGFVSLFIDTEGNLLGLHSLE